MTRIATLLALLLLALPARAQDCRVNITLTTQADVDAFACTNITRDLYIGGVSGAESDINDLSPLDGLTEVLGSLRVMYSPGLTDLTGLDDLTKVGVDLEIRDNHGLTSLTGLESLTSVGHSGAGYGDFYIWINSSLTSLGALSALTSVGGDLLVSYNDVLPSLAGLESLTSLGALYVASNPVLSALANFTGITETRILDFQGNAALTGLTGLETVETTGDLNIEDTALTSLAGLAGLTTIEGELYLSGNASLTSLAGLSGLTSLNALWIESSSGLTSLAGLEGIQELPGDLAINGNPALASLTGLDGLVVIGGGLYIEDNDALESLGGLGSLATVRGSTWITGNLSLASLGALGELASVGEGGGGAGVTSEELNVSDNAALNSCLCGLSDLIENTSPYGFTLSTTIENNAPGCNAPDDLLDDPALPDVFVQGYPVDAYGSTNQVASPVAIPPGGGTAYYYTRIVNGSAPVGGRPPITTQMWPAIGFPDGTVIVKRRALEVTLNDSEAIIFNGQVNLPASFPPGTYTFYGYAGAHPSCGYRQITFQMEKTDVMRAGVRTLTSEEIRKLDFDDFATFSHATLSGAPGAPVPDGSASASLPSETALGRGYPNPFNPTATISFTLAAAGDVRLAVYDLLGREVAVLAEGFTEAGGHTAVFDASALASGTYLVRLTAADGHAHTQRLTLLK